MLKRVSPLAVLLILLGAPALADEMRFVPLPVGLELPVKLNTPGAPLAGDTVMAVTRRTVVLPTGETLPRGTKVFGNAININGMRRLMFDTLELSDGTTFPISASVIQSKRELILKLQAPAQVAVTGTVL